MTRLGIVGYGNLGKAFERLAHSSEGIDLVGVFTRRHPSEVYSPFNTPIYSTNDLCAFEGKIDVLVICLGSSSSLTDFVLDVARTFNTVDCFDNHHQMDGYLCALDKVAVEHNHLSIVGAGWDPGLFSLMRGLFYAILPDGVTNTFWGRGVSQGHSEAIRQIAGVKKAVQYTVPKSDAVAKAKAGQGARLTAEDMHLRECFVVVEDGVDTSEVEAKIKSIPHYFAGYDTVVHFVGEDEFNDNHTSMAHGGLVTVFDVEVGHLNFHIDLPSNPDFTARVLMAYSKCVDFLHKRGLRGAKTTLQLSVSDLLGDNGKSINKFL